MVVKHNWVGLRLGTRPSPTPQFSVLLQYKIANTRFDIQPAGRFNRSLCAYPVLYSYQHNLSLWSCCARPINKVLTLESVLQYPFC